MFLMNLAVCFAADPGFQLPPPGPGGGAVNNTYAAFYYAKLAYDWYNHMPNRQETPQSRTPGFVPFTGTGHKMGKSS